MLKSIKNVISANERVVRLGWASDQSEGILVYRITWAVVQSEGILVNERVVGWAVNQSEGF